QLQTDKAKRWSDVFIETNTADDTPPTPAVYYKAWKDQWLGPDRSRFDKAESEFLNAKKQKDETYVEFMTRVQYLCLMHESKPTEAKIVSQIIKGLVSDRDIHDRLYHAHPASLKELQKTLTLQDDVAKAHQASALDSVYHRIAKKAIKKAAKTNATEVSFVPQ